MAKAKPRTVEYYRTLFTGTGTEFDMKKLYSAAKIADDLHDFPKRSAAAYQIWASKMLRRLEDEPGLVTIIRNGREYKSIKILNTEECAKLLGWGEKTEEGSTKETPKPVATPAPVVPVKIELFTNNEDKLCVVCKALRYAVRESRGGKWVAIDPEKLREACLHKERFPEVPEILQYFSEVGLDLSIPTISEKERKVVFRGHCTGLKKVCEKGKPLYPRWTKLWSFEGACDDDKILAAALETIREEERAKTAKKPVVKISADTVLTDDDKFRIFVIGGYLMDRMEETHENASLTQLATVLTKKGKGLSTLRLESLVSSTPEFFVDDDEVYLSLGKEDKKTWWDKFRKKYRPLSGETEQIIFRAWMDLDYVSAELKNCRVILVDELSNGFNVFRVDLPKNSIVARYSFAELIRQFRESRGEKLYTESKLIDSLRAMRDKKNAAWKFQDDLYRWEIGAFGKKGV